MGKFKGKKKKGEKSRAVNRYDLKIICLNILIYQIIYAIIIIDLNALRILCLYELKSLFYCVKLFKIKNKSQAE